jgi:dipeptidase E
MQASGLFKVMPEWLKTKIYVGVSAGSQVAGESLRATSESLSENGEFYNDGYNEFGPKGQSSNKTLQLVDFVFRPHLNSPEFPKIREELLDKVATNLGIPMYAADDQTALKIIDDRVEVISEGKWRLFNPR